MHSPSGRYLGYFYPRPPRGGRRFLLFFFGEFIEISIHALREEGDPYMPEVFHDVMKFLSTPSARRATFNRLLHLLHLKLFLSTPSARRATYVDVAEAFDTVFLSTPSARRATTMGWSTR